MLYVSPLYFQLASPIIRTAFDDTDIQTFVEIPQKFECQNIQTEAWGIWETLHTYS